MKFQYRCENRAREIGIAVLDLKQLHLLQITQFNDSPSYSQALSYAQMLNPSIILFPNSQKGSRLHQVLSALSNDNSPLQIMIVARKYFDETEGQRLLMDLMVIRNTPIKLSYNE